MANSLPSGRPAHLDPSELGTKDYWDKYYQNDLDLEEEVPEDPADLESWFDDVDAPTKVFEYLNSEDFPLSPSNSERAVKHPHTLDLGTGNGSVLFQMRLEGDWHGPMTGVDYSQQSINLARRLWNQYNSSNPAGQGQGTKEEIRFERIDLIHDDPTLAEWWPDQGGFDLVLDKGTFDAIALSSDTVADAGGQERRICELYPGRIARMVVPGGFLMVTSCNWTEAEVIRWFTESEGVKGVLEEYGRVAYPVYEFGGRKGQGVASVCFRRLES